ncbi:MotE family protein [Roseospira visakhapatnamensis]|uniref:Flagellar motility protein MotE (MotC chaperone) n=1 Tax=Roseospira visakhapatnamensis TaxID=390880 RepID=A0A7W6RDU8_9PROT|nr:hypothetical protein [Roseospira visakhapatnamensis]MBB4266726.1 flagellar motility protein MotE (MotC chaperone) [Roseospira visakhapatnamensis]
MAPATRKTHRSSPSLPRIGILHAVIGIAFFMLSIRLGALYEDINGWSGPVSLGQSQALARAETTSGAGAETPERAPPESEPDGSATPGASSTQPVRGAPDMAAEAAAGLTPPGFTQSEINLLQRLAERREELEARERELGTREALLQAAERRIEARVGELRELETVIEGLLEKHSEQEMEQINQLVRIYASMKPKDAARIFNDLDMPILLTVIENMKERSSAAILAEMTPDRAKQVTTELAQRRALPGSSGIGDQAGRP